MNGERFLDELPGGPADRAISRRRVLELVGATIACGALASVGGLAARAQVATVAAASPDTILGPAIATMEQAHRWLSANDAHYSAYGWIDLAWEWGSAVGVRPDLMLAQEMFETGWGYFGGTVLPGYHNVAGIKVSDPEDAGTTENFEWFASWSEGIRAHANHLGAYCGAAPVLGSNGEPVHDRYYVVTSTAWAGTVETTDGLSGTWSTRGDYARVLHESFLDPLRNT